MISVEAVQAVHSLICEESLEDHMDPAWPGRCVKAVQAAAPHLMAAAWDEGCKKGLATNPVFEEGALARNPYLKAKR